MRAFILFIISTISGLIYFNHFSYFYKIRDGFARKAILFLTACLGAFLIIDGFGHYLSAFHLLPSRDIMNMLSISDFIVAIPAFALILYRYKK